MKLIDNWQQWHKFWSVRLQLAGAAILTFLEAFPDAAISIWAVLPADIRASIHPDAIRYAGYAIIACGIVARIVKQPRLGQESKPSVQGDGVQDLQRPGDRA